MNDEEKKHLKHLMKLIEDRKSVIANERDKIRELYSDIEDMLDSLDRGVEGIEMGLLDMRNGIDALSERL